MSYSENNFHLQISASSKTSAWRECPNDPIRPPKSETAAGGGSLSFRGFLTLTRSSRGSLFQSRKMGTKSHTLCIDTNAEKMCGATHRQFQSNTISIII